jgi:hypothetical protein
MPRNGVVARNTPRANFVWQRPYRLCICNLLLFYPFMSYMRALANAASWVSIWSSWAPLRCKMAAWLFVRERVWTADRLAKRGSPHNSKWALCNVAKENALHLFTVCAVVNIIWSNVLQWANLQQVRHRLNSLVILVTWSVRWERNARVFERNFKPINILIDQIKADAKQWSFASMGWLSFPGT